MPYARLALHRINFKEHMTKQSFLRNMLGLLKNLVGYLRLMTYVLKIASMQIFRMQRYSSVLAQNQNSFNNSLNTAGAVKVTRM